MTLQQPLLIKNLRTDNHPTANEAMYLMTEVMSKMRMDVVEAVMSRVKNVTEIVVVSMLMQNVVSMRMMVGIVVSMLRMNVVSIHYEGCGTNDGDCGVHDEDECGVHDKDVAVSGCAENKCVGDDDLDDVRESWLTSFWSPVDCSPLSLGEELLESSSISEDINMSATCDRSFFYNFR